MNDRTDSERLAVIESAVLKLSRDLFGNGQPGVIKAMSKRIGKLETYLAIAIGGGAVVIWMIEAATR